MSRSALAQIERLTQDLSPEEQLQLLEHLAGQLRQASASGGPRDLYGAWKGKFPDEFDIDAALAEIRSGWQSDEPA